MWIFQKRNQLKYNLKLNTNMDEKIIQQVTEYVYKNYRTYKDKQLIIREKSNCFHIMIHEDGSPLILGKGIIK